MDVLEKLLRKSTLIYLPRLSDQLKVHISTDDKRLAVNK